MAASDLVTQGTGALGQYGTIPAWRNKWDQARLSFIIVNCFSFVLDQLSCTEINHVAVYLNLNTIVFFFAKL